MTALQLRTGLSWTPLDRLCTCPGPATGCYRGELIDTQGRLRTEKLRPSLLAPVPTSSGSHPPPLPSPHAPPRLPSLPLSRSSALSPRLLATPGPQRTRTQPIPTSYCFRSLASCSSWAPETRTLSFSPLFLIFPPSTTSQLRNTCRITLNIVTRSF